MPQTTIQCRGCGTPIPTDVYSFIDVTQTPQAKPMLLSGRINRAICPQCGTENIISTPLLYHDPTKELLIALVPMELNMTKDQQEKAVGTLMNQLPKENFKGYMFSPRRAITLQGLMDQIFEADGITKEMLEDQRKRVELAQKFAEAKDPQALDALIKEHDGKIDEMFFQAMTMIAQRMIESGRPDIAQSIIAKQSIVAQKSTYGQEMLKQQQLQQEMVEKVANDIDALGENATREDFLKLAIDYAGHDEKLQALVGLVRPVFDYEFFQLVTVKISQSPANQRSKITEMRERLLELTAMIDEQQKQAAQNAAGFLQAILQSENPDELLEANLHMVDDTFMAVLNANIQYAQQQGNIQASARLKEIYNMAVSALQQNMQPELRFINDLLSTDDDAQATALIQNRAKEFGDELLEVMEAVEQLLQNQGNQPLAQRLKALKAQAQAVLSYD